VSSNISEKTGVVPESDYKEYSAALSEWGNIGYNIMDEITTGDKEKDAEVVAATKAAGFENLKGHKSVGGLRASIYNAMPKEGVEALVEFLKKYEAEHQA